MIAEASPLTNQSPQKTTMAQKPQRPAWVTVFAAVYAVGGIVLLATAVALGTLGSGNVSGWLVLVPVYLVGFLGIVPLPFLFVWFGIAALFYAFGLWSGKRWGWTLGVALAVECVVVWIVIVVIVFPVSVNQLTLPPLAFYLLMFWYLWRPHVRAYFGKGPGTPAVQPERATKRPSQAAS